MLVIQYINQYLSSKTSLKMSKNMTDVTRHLRGGPKPHLGSLPGLLTTYKNLTDLSSINLEMHTEMC